MTNNDAQEKPIKRLIAMEYQIESSEEADVSFPVGFTYVYLTDPLTGKFYEPVDGWEVTGANLEELFNEVKPLE